MEFNNVIETRRSIRGFDAEKKVTKDELSKMIEAAILAPSWKNSQTARYYCVCSDEMVEKFSNECLPAFNQTSSKNAALVVTTFVTNRAGFNKETGEADNECGNGWGYYDLGLHNANLVLKATEMGLGTLIMGIRDGEKIRTMLDIPETEAIVSVIAVGYPTVEPTMPRRKSVEDIAKFF